MASVLYHPRLIRREDLEEWIFSGEEYRISDR